MGILRPLEGLVDSLSLLPEPDRFLAAQDALMLTERSQRLEGLLNQWVVVAQRPLADTLLLVERSKRVPHRLR